MVDCIYIDPPYNTGAKDWKYNNDYVDSSDAYRHSKWLSMMKKRLVLAKKLLNPKESVLIVTIDGNSIHSIGEVFKGNNLNEVIPPSNTRTIWPLFPNGKDRLSSEDNPHHPQKCPAC